jgi:hypothetical protein
MQVNTVHIELNIAKLLMLVSCMSLYTKHNYRAKKLNYLTLKLSTQRGQRLVYLTSSCVNWALYGISGQV